MFVGALQMVIGAWCARECARCATYAAGRDRIGAAVMFITTMMLATGGVLALSVAAMFVFCWRVPS